MDTEILGWQYIITVIRKALLFTDPVVHRRCSQLELQRQTDASIDQAHHHHLELKQLTVSHCLKSSIHSCNCVDLTYKIQALLLMLKY